MIRTRPWYDARREGTGVGLRLSSQTFTDVVIECTQRWRCGRIEEKNADRKIENADTDVKKRTSRVCRTEKTQSKESERDFASETEDSTLTAALSTLRSCFAERD